jgi:ABC-type uncharacterized transport system permease subunit
MPPLATLDALMRRTIAIAVPFLTVGLIVGIARLQSRGGGVDALMVATVITWLLYTAFLVLRPTGRHAAQFALAGFALVILVRVVLEGTHVS